MARKPHIASALSALEAGDFKRARQASTAALKEDPSSPELQHLAGLIECRAGDPSRGIDNLRRAAEAVPDNLPFRVMLVRALVDSGRFGEALAASDPGPENCRLPSALWHARAEAADKAEDWERSAEAWMALAQAQPDDWRAHANAGNAWLRLDQWHHAEAVLSRAARLNPGDATIRFSLGAALAQSGRTEDAVAAFLQGLEIDPTHLQGRVTLARIYADKGDGVAATRQLELAAGHAADWQPGGARLSVSLSGRAGDNSQISVSADDTISVREIGRLFERTGQMDKLRELLWQADAADVPDDQLGYLRARLALSDGDAEVAQTFLDTEKPDSDPLRWHGLAARIADRMLDPERAFAEAERMNRSVADYDGWRRRGADYRAKVRDLASAYDRHFVENIAPIPPSGRRSPAFLVGFPRSGTTLLDTFLMGHPETQVLEEVHMLGPAERVIGKVQSLPHVTADELAQARDAYFSVLDDNVEPGFGGLIIDKMPLNMIGLPFLHALFPDSKIIFAQRHPADCVLSGLMQSFTLNDAMASFLDIEDAADLYDAAMAAFTRGRDAVRVPVHTLVYERLVANPSAELRTVIDFLGLEWDDALLDHQSTARSRGVIVTPSYDQVTRPLDRAPAGRWERYRTQMSSVLPLLTGWADKLGYPQPHGGLSQ